MIGKYISDQTLFLSLNKMARSDPFMSWSQYLNTVRNADKEYLSASPVRFDLKLDSPDRERVIFFISTVNRDENVKQYGGLVFAFNLDKKEPRNLVDLRHIHYICVETGARIREAYYTNSNNLFDKFLFKYRKKYPSMINRINDELKRTRVIQ